MNPEYSSKFYFRPAQKREPIGGYRYLHRAQQIKRIDPKGVYAAFNLSTNKGVSDKPTTDRGEIIFG